MSREEIMGLYEDVMFANDHNGYEYPGDAQSDEDEHGGLNLTASAERVAVGRPEGSGRAEGSLDDVVVSSSNLSLEETTDGFGKRDLIRDGDADKIEQVSSALSVSKNIATQLLTVRKL
jgi:hypothetical protein